MATEKVLAKGLRFFDKHPSAPDFVVGTIVITPADINTMFAENHEYVTEYHGAAQLKLQLLKSKDGKMYAVIDTYKKDGGASKPTNNTSVKGNTVADEDPNSLPF